MGIALINPATSLGEPVAILDGNEGAWATETERTPVFTIRRPNPNAGQIIERSAEGWDGEEPLPAPEYEPEFIDVEYTMPARPNPSFGIALAARARRGYSMDDVMGWAIDIACGEGALEALLDDLEGLDEKEQKEVMRGISRRIQVVAAGALPKAPTAS